MQDIAKSITTLAYLVILCFALKRQCSLDFWWLRFSCKSGCHFLNHVAWVDNVHAVAGIDGRDDKIPPHRYCTSITCVTLGARWKRRVRRGIPQCFSAWGRAGRRRKGAQGGWIYISTTRARVRCTRIGRDTMSVGQVPGTIWQEGRLCH